MPAARSPADILVLALYALSGGSVLKGFMVQTIAERLGIDFERAEAMAIAADKAGLVRHEVVLDAAREFDEPEGPFIGVPREEELKAAAAVARCQLAPRLRGPELTALRNILDLTQPALSAALGGKAAVTTISRWEAELRDIGEEYEKLIRVLVCERLKGQAPGVPYDVLAMLALPLEPRMKKMAPMEFRHVEVKAGRSIDHHWTTTALAAGQAGKAAA